MQNSENRYEFTFLVDDATALKPIENILGALEGKKLDESPWGKRLLSYPIDKKTAAEYYTWHIEMNPTKLDEFKKKLNYDKLVIRYIILNSEESSIQMKKPSVKEENTAVE